MSLLLGVAAIGKAEVVPAIAMAAAAGLTVYIASVTVIAAKETQLVRIGRKRWFPAVSLVLCFGVIGSMAAVEPVNLEWVSTILAVFALVWVWRQGHGLAGVPEPSHVARTIGKFIQALLIVQAMFISMCGVRGLIGAAILLTMMPVQARLARKFYSS